MTNILAALSGVLVGVIQGIIGGGGSVLGVPLLIYGVGGSVLGVPLLIYGVGVRDPHVAIGTSAVAIAVAAFVSLIGYMRAGHVKWRCGATFTFAGLIGAIAGSSLGKTFPAEKLILLFGGLMIVIAGSMLLGRPRAGKVNVWLDRETAPRLAPRLLAIGGGVGFLSGFFGIGGGFLAVPGLLMAAEMPLVFAIGTSLMSVAIFGLATAVNYAASGLVDWGVTAHFMAGGVVGGFAGGRLARSLAARGPALSRVFAVVVALVGALLIAESRRIW
jgi:uncharacterized membrane protein YfcA